MAGSERKTFQSGKSPKTTNFYQELIKLIDTCNTFIKKESNPSIFHMATSNAEERSKKMSGLIGLMEFLDVTKESFDNIKPKDNVEQSSLPDEIMAEENILKNPEEGTIIPAMGVGMDGNIRLFSTELSKHEAKLKSLKCKDFLKAVNEFRSNVYLPAINPREQKRSSPERK